MRIGKSQSGFSMVELMTVVVIMMIVMVVAIPNFIQTYRTNRLNGAIADFKNIILRTRFEAVRLNQSVACRLAPGPRITLYIDLNSDGIQQPTEPVAVLGGEFQFAIGGTPGPGSMGVGLTAVPPLRMTFNGRGAPDYTNSVVNGVPVGMGFSPATPTLLTTLGNASRPQDGYRAVTISPLGKLTVWRAQASGTWSHTQ